MESQKLRREDGKMSYPPPLPFESQERLYQQAQFFYDEYEKMKARLEEIKSRLEAAEKEIDLLRRANLDKYGTTEATELLQLRQKFAEQVAEAERYYRLDCQNHQTTQAQQTTTIKGLEQKVAEQAKTIEALKQQDLCDHSEVGK